MRKTRQLLFSKLIGHLERSIICSYQRFNLANEEKKRIIPSRQLLHPFFLFRGDLYYFNEYSSYIINNNLLRIKRPLKSYERSSGTALHARLLYTQPAKTCKGNFPFFPFLNEEFSFFSRDFTNVSKSWHFENNHQKIT